MKTFSLVAHSIKNGELLGVYQSPSKSHIFDSMRNHDDVLVRWELTVYEPYKKPIHLDIFEDIQEYLHNSSSLSLEILLKETDVFYEIQYVTVEHTITHYEYTAQDVLAEIAKIQNGEFPENMVIQLSIVSKKTGVLVTLVRGIPEIEFIVTAFLGVEPQTPEQVSMSDAICSAKVPGNIPVYSTPQVEHSIYAEFLDKEGKIDLPKYFAQNELQRVIHDLEKLLGNVSDPYIAVNLGSINKRLGVIVKELHKKWVVRYKVPVDSDEIALANLSLGRDSPITPRVAELAKHVVETYVSGEHQPHVVAAFEEIYTSGKFQLYDMIDFIRYITLSGCWISKYVYAWFDDITEQMFPYLHAAQKV